MSALQHFPVVLSPGEDGWVVATCPVIPGCTTQGRNRDEALLAIREAIELCLESRDDEGWELPASFEMLNVDVAA